MSIQNPEKLISEEGAEAIQLAFSIPILIVIFALCMQLCVWVFAAIQFSNAAESTAYHVNIEQLIQAGINTEDGKKLIAQEISSRMLGVSPQEINVQNVKLNYNEENDAKNSTEHTTNNLCNNLQLVQSQSTACLKISASYCCPTLINILSPLHINNTWQRDRLLTRKAEVQETHG